MLCWSPSRGGQFRYFIPASFVDKNRNAAVVARNRACFIKYRCIASFILLIIKGVRWSFHFPHRIFAVYLSIIQFFFLFFALSDIKYDFNELLCYRTFFFRSNVNIVSNLLLLAINKHARYFHERELELWARVLGLHSFFCFLYIQLCISIFLLCSPRFRFFFVFFAAFVSFIAIPLWRQSIASDEEIEYELLYETSLSR